LYWIVVKGNGYVTNKNKGTALDLWCAQGIDSALPHFDDSLFTPKLNEGESMSFAYWGDYVPAGQKPCLMAEWLNGRFYDSIPENWKTIMAFAIVECDQRKL
jgi:hypothetical protein